MAKVDLGFDIANKPTHVADKCVEIRCNRSNTMSLFAWGNELPEGQTWGDLVWSDMTERRQQDARDALEIWEYV